MYEHCIDQISVNLNIVDGYMNNRQIDKPKNNTQTLDPGA